MLLQNTYEGDGMGTVGFGNWGFIIFFLFILYYFTKRDPEHTTNCDLRLQEASDTARIEYNSLLETRNSKDAIMAQASAIRNEQQAETIFDLKNENTVLKQNQYLDARFGAIEKAYAECCCGLNRRLDSIECQIPQRPPYFAQGFVTTGQPIPQGCGC